MPSRIFATQLAAIIEETEGTPGTLAAAQAILCKAIAFTPTQEQYQRELLRGSLSRDPSVSGKRSAKLAFTVEMRGSGTPGTPPDYGPLLKGCGFSETISANVSVTYKPATASIPSLTVAAYMDGIRKLIFGARGTVRFEMVAGQPGLMHFEFEGADFVVETLALLTGITYTAIVPPAFLSAGLLLNAYAAICSKVEIDVANVLQKRESINKSSGYISTLITGRNPKGSMDPELPLIATHDFYGLWRTPGTLGSLTLAATGSGGNIVTVSCPKVRYAAIAPGDRGGLRMLGLDFEPTLSAGDDEISIALT